MDSKEADGRAAQITAAQSRMHLMLDGAWIVDMGASPSAGQGGLTLRLAILQSRQGQCDSRHSSVFDEFDKIPKRRSGFSGRARGCG